MFQHEIFYDERCLEIFRFDMAWWVKSEWGELVPSVTDLMCRFGDIKVPRSYKKRTRH